MTTHAPNPGPRSLDPRALLAGLLACSGCAYDLAPLEEAVKARGDAGDGGDTDTPEPLIDLFDDVDDTCRECVVTRCAEENQRCHDDPECVAVTTCLADATDPRGHAECREAHRAWFEAHMADIDVGGPLYDCAFWQACTRQCGADQDLACVGDYRWPTAESGAEVEVSLLLQEALRLEPAVGARARVCRIEDLDCDQPSMSDVSDDEGRVDLVLPAPLGQFTGYVEITGADLAPTLLVFGWPVSTGDARRMPIVSATTLALQRRAGGLPPVADTGLVQARVFGCGGVGTRDVRVTVRPDGDDVRTWYFDGQLPDFRSEGTYPNGNAGVVNVPPGLVDVLGTYLPDDREVLRWRVPVRSDHLTILIGAPSDR